ncbi:MAG: helix-turn-helix domain-containing protein [Propionibacteriaceae bacterium]|jgi:excisionase family DNA binding protein|nr:helix-turn-helix domain-containing protein [Propionibacteriaceae bacterium]
MTTLEITPDTIDWAETIAQHLATGGHARVRLEVPSMTPQEMADHLGRSRSAIMNWIAQGKIKTIRHGNRHRIALAEVERFRRWYITESASLLAQDF